MRKVLVTGAAGFVGRHLVRRLLEFGDEVHAVDSLVPGTGGIDPSLGWPLFDPRAFDHFHFYREDCRSWFLRRRDSDFAYAFHLAAVIGGRIAIENNPLAVADDLSIDAAYWQWAKDSRPGKSVCFSSSAAYPIRFQRHDNFRLLTEDMISFEDDIGVPDMTYDWAKLTCEYLGRLAHQRHGLRCVFYRPFSGYGEDQDDAYPFPSICKRVLAEQGADVVRVWGSGRQMRDFIHIEDCVDGILATMDRVHDSGAINLSTGILTSFASFASLAAECVGYSPRIEGMSDRPEGVFARGGDTTKQTRMGFAFKTDFRAGIERALRYYANRR